MSASLLNFKFPFGLNGLEITRALTNSSNNINTDDVKINDNCIADYVLIFDMFDSNVMKNNLKKRRERKSN